MEPKPEEPDFDLVVPPKEGAPEEQRAHRRAMRAISARWGSEHATRIEALTKELLTAAPDAPADEALVLRTAAATSVVCEVLNRAQLQLATRLELLVDDPKLMLAIARALRETCAVTSATTKSFEELLGAAATMRAQRSLVRAQAKKEKTWHEQVGGGHLDSSRRDLSGRRPTAN